MKRVYFLTGAFLAIHSVVGIGQPSCISFTSSNSAFSIVSGRKAAPILLSSDDWPGVHLAASNFAADINRVSGIKPAFRNITSPSQASGTPPIIVGTLGKSSLIDQIVNATQLDVSSISGKWEAYLSREVKNPLPGVQKAYVIIGADKRGTIYALYDHSEQIGGHVVDYRRCRG